MFDLSIDWNPLELSESKSRQDKYNESSSA